MQATYSVSVIIFQVVVIFERQPWFDVPPLRILQFPLQILGAGHQNVIHCFHVVRNAHVIDGVAATVPFPQEEMALLAVAALAEQSLYNRPLTGTHRKMQRRVTKIHDASSVHWTKESARHLMKVMSLCNNRGRANLQF
jgi:hypothetical protein